MLSNLCHVLCQKECFGSYLYFFLTIKEMIEVLFSPAKILWREMDAANSTPDCEAMVRFGDDCGHDGQLGRKVKKDIQDGGLQLQVLVIRFLDGTVDIDTVAAFTEFREFVVSKDDGSSLASAARVTLP